MRQTKCFRLLLSLPIVWLVGCKDFEFQGKNADYFFPEPVQAELARAAAKGSLGKIEDILKDGGEVNYAGKKGFTAAYWALLAGNSDAFEYLIRNGADVEQRVFDDTVALITSAARRDDNIFLKILLANNANIESTRGNTITALREAAKFGKHENVKYLVENCANLHQSGPNHATAVVDAIAGIRGFTSALYLLEQGSSHNLHMVTRFLTQTGPPADPDYLADYNAIIKILTERGIDVQGIAEGRVERPSNLPPPKPAYGKDCKNPPSG